MNNLSNTQQIKILSASFYDLNKDRFENPGELLKAKLEYLKEKGLIKAVSYPSIKLAA